MAQFVIKQEGYRLVTRTVTVEAETEEEAMEQGIEEIGDQPWEDGAINEFSLDTTIDEDIPTLT